MPTPTPTPRPGADEQPYEGRAEVRFFSVCAVGAGVIVGIEPASFLPMVAAVVIGTIGAVIIGLVEGGTDG